MNEQQQRPQQKQVQRTPMTDAEILADVLARVVIERAQRQSVAPKP